jgi:3-hydroxyacyl-CoA dehydrogenase
VVLAQDKPGFIANRFGMWNLFHTIHTAERLGLTVEQVDEISGTFLGRPKSATFRLADIIGLDVMRDIANNLKSSLTEDPKTATFEIPNSMLSLLGRGWIGDKTGHGYYRREGKETLVLDFATFAYRMPREVQFPDSAELNALPLGERLAKGLDLKSEVGEFLREALIPALVYADELKAQVSHSVADFDNVMKWGFGWEKGPFELIDCIGSQKVWPQRVEDGPDHPYYKQGSVRGFHGGYTNLPKHPEFETLHDFKQIEVGETYRLRDMGNGVIAIVLTSKMGVLSPKVVAELKQVFGQKFSHYVLTSEAKCFSAGFDIQFLNQHVQDGEFHKIEEGLLNLQELGELMQTKPGATAIFTYCLGAGLELALSSHTIVADAESQIGLPESRLGLIPGGRGVCLMRQNNAFNAKRLAEVTLTMAQGTISSNADHAKQLGYLRNTDKVVYDRDRLFFIAKQAALDATVVAEDLWKPALGPLVGMIDELVAKQRASGAFTEYDEFIAGKLRQIVARSTSYQDAIERERTEFVDLAKRTLTQTRLRHMLDHGTALRN